MHVRFVVVTFPGSNCDRDCLWVIEEVLGQPAKLVRHTDDVLSDADCVVLPGGFSYGDYLRAGAVAAHTPVMDAVREFAYGGGLVLGICNGFQMLCEAGLLPGSLMVNDHLRFACRSTWVRVEDDRTPFTCGCREGQVLRIPIAHHQGNYRTGSSGEPGRVVLRYSSRQGEVRPQDNPNGSWDSVAAVSNHAGNVLGMMPHPERCAEEVLGGTDGLYVFRSVLKWWEEARRDE